MASTNTCAECGTKYTPSLFGRSREARTQQGMNIRFCTPVCRRRFTTRNNAKTFCRQP